MYGNITANLQKYFLLPIIGSPNLRFFWFFFSFFFSHKTTIARTLKLLNTFLSKMNGPVSVLFFCYKKQREQGKWGRTRLVPSFCLFEKHKEHRKQ